MKVSINIKLATSWNELSEKQLQHIAATLEWYAKTMATCPESEKPAIQVKLYLALVKNLLRSNNPFKVWIAMRQLPIQQYQDNVKFLLDSIKRTKFPKPFKIGKNIFYSPGDRLANLSIKEFSFVDSMFYNWRQGRKQLFLDLLCAALYRTGTGANPDYDMRKPYIKNLVEKDVKLFEKLPHKKKLAIAYAYEGSRNYIVGLYPNIFPPPPKTSEDEEKEGRPAPKYVPFGELLVHKIKFDPSKLEITQNLNLHEFLSTYENELREMKKRK